MILTNNELSETPSTDCQRYNRNPNRWITSRRHKGNTRTRPMPVEHCADHLAVDNLMHPLKRSYIYFKTPDMQWLIRISTRTARAC